MTFYRQDISETGHFIHKHFIYIERTLINRTFQRQGISETGHFWDRTFKRRIVMDRTYHMNRTYHIARTFHRQDNFIDNTFYRWKISLKTFYILLYIIYLHIVIFYSKYIYIWQQNNFIFLCQFVDMKIKIL